MTEALGILWKEFKEANAGLSKEEFVEKYACPFLIITQREANKDSEDEHDIITNLLATSGKETIHDSQAFLGYKVTRRVFYLPFENHPNPVIRVGRAADCEVCLNLPGISKHHAFLIRSAGSNNLYLLKDANSTNGTTVNGRRLSDNERCNLDFGDKIGFSKGVLGNFLAPESVSRLLYLL